MSSPVRIHPLGVSKTHFTPPFVGDPKVEEDLAADSYSLKAVPLRDRRRLADSATANRAKGSALPQGGLLQNAPNRRNATYLTQEEYDEDLAQLDILLHYVNNLSASLEFLQWENKRISTDLVPTLLNMYDALYARLSESSHGGVQDTQGECRKSPEGSPLGGLRKGKEEEEEEEEKVLFITEPSPEVDRKLTGSVAERRGPPRTGAPPVSESHAENDYDIPEFVEDATPCSTPRLPSPKGRLRGKRLLQGARSAPETPVGEGKNPVGTRGLLPYRPVSVISSSSSSSTSSNSLPRGEPVGGLNSYLASAESLEEDNNALHSDSETSTRRRDRGIKARREKALRTGSGDSGVQCHIISLPAPPSNRPRYCDPNLGYMDKVVLEIVETEEIYVRDLKEVIEGYLEFWRRTPEQGICVTAIESLFSNIEQIYEFNKCFLTELQKCDTNPVAVAKCFVRNNLGFAIYTEYCTNYPRTVSLLTDLMREESSVRACRERQLYLGHTLPLGSYLLKPVQRVLKYHLLLGNIVKHFSKERAGYSHIWNALSAMTGIAHHINDMKRKHEHAVRVQEIQSLLYGWQGEDLTTYGELAAEGTFKIFGFKGLRHVFLFDKILLISKRKDENILMYKAHIMCSDLMLIEAIPGEPLSFHVIPFDNPKCQYTLECRNLDEKREWTLQLKRVILENYNATIPAHARQLVMELGQAKNNDISGNDWRGGGRKAHHAPEYLERRKDKRRASEGGINARLRIRRSSRTRKTKEEKELRSRSASRTRETDEEEERKPSSNAPSPGEKSRIKLPMWRRRSEPGVRGRLRISSPEVPQTPPVEAKEETEKREEEREEEEPRNTEEKEANLPKTPEVDCNSSVFDQYDGDDNEPVAGENLEQIVSQLLQHQLQMQKIILNKQRRGLVRKKKFGFQYETSDTENEDGNCESRPPLPSSPPPLLTSSNQPPLPFPADYRNLGISRGEKEGDWSSGGTSLCSSIHSINRKDSVGSPSVSRSGSDIGTKEVKVSNYDNLMNVWGGTASKHSKENTLPRGATEDLNQINKGNVTKLSLRRVHSFSSASVTSKEELKSNDNNESHAQSSSPNIADEARHSEKEAKGRPVTIAVYDQASSNLNSPDIYDSERNRSQSSLSKQSHFSVDNLISIHPEHKIYAKAFVNKGSIKKVLNKLANPKGTPNKTVSEPSCSLSNLYVNSEFEKSMNRKPSGLVSSMARQCSRTLKERIKQIRTEDLDSPVRSPSNGSLVGLSTYKQGSSSIGARLAASSELSDYAVPVIRGNDRPSSKSELRPDSVLSSSSVWTSSSSSSNSSNRERETRTCLEEDPPPTVLGIEDLSGDSFYEKSFEAIESFLDDEMFRDSAIYSEPEDGTETLSSRGGTLSPKNSFNYKHRSSFRVDRNEESPLLLRRKNDLMSSFQKNEEGCLVNGLMTSSPLRIVEGASRGPRSLDSTPIPTLTKPSAKKVPPPVPAKPDSTKFRSRGTLIQQQLKNLEERGKSFARQEPIRTEDRTLSSPLSSQSTGEEAMMSKGWVKHVVGKLQQ